MNYEEISLSGGKFKVKVNSCIAPFARLVSWKCIKAPNGLLYARTEYRLKSGRRLAVYLHRAVAIAYCYDEMMGFEEPVIRHKNHDGLDCRLENLKIVERRVVQRAGGKMTFALSEKEKG